MSRLMVFTENYGRGGGNRYLVDLVNAIGSDYDDVVVCSNPGGIFDEDKARFSVRVAFREIGIITHSRLYIERGASSSRFDRKAIHLAGTHDGWLFAYNRMLFRWAVSRIRPDAILVCNGGYPAARSALALVIEAGPRVPTALSVVSTPYPRQEDQRGEAERLLDTQVWRAARVVIVNARMIADKLTETRGMPSELASVVHNGLPSVDRDRAPRDKGPVTIGCVARFDPEKGHATLVEAFAGVAAGDPDVRLVLVGDGREHEAVVRQVAELGLADRVSLPGHLDSDIEDILEEFDIFAFPSIQEGLPYSLLEAMRAGCAIVSTDVGGIPEAVTNGETGLLVPPSDATAMAAALRALTADPALRARLADSARIRFDSEFSLEAMSRRARQVLHEAGMSSF